MALTLNSKVKELMKNEECCREIDRICPGLMNHPHIGLAKNFTLNKCAELLPEQLTPEVMTEIAEMLERVTGKADESESIQDEKTYREPFWNFDEIIDRENTNSSKYGAGNVLNPYLPDEYISMWVADMDFACPQPVLDAMHERLERKILGYSTALDPEYYAAVINWEERRHHIKVSMDQIVTSNGVICAMQEAVRRLTKPGDKVLVNTPAYHPFDDSIKLYDRTPLYSPLINDGTGYYTYDWEDLEKKAADPAVTLYFLCNPHNPSGRVWTEEELRRVAEIMFKNHVFIFCDEIWHDHIRREVEHTSLAALYPDRKGYMVATAPSKTFNLAGNLLANLIIPDREMAAEWLMNIYCGNPSPLSLEACRAAYVYCDGWVDAMRKYIDENFAYMDAYLKKHLSKAVFHVPEGTYLAWIDVRAWGMSDAKLKEIISKAGLFIEFGNEFVSDAEGFIRINVACPHSVLKKALGILCRALGGTSEQEISPIKEIVPKQLHTGDYMPDYKVDTLYAEEVALSDLMSEKGSVLVLLRYAGCPLCQLDIRNYINNIQGFHEKLVNPIIVLQSTKESVKKQLDSQTLPFTVICDPKGVLYKNLQVPTASGKLSLAGGMTTVNRLKEAKKTGVVHGAYEGEELQLPAIFAFDETMKIKYAHYAKNVSDMPAPKDIIELL